MKDALSLWRSPIDEVAIAAANDLAARQPRCDYPINLAPVLATPGLADTVPIYHAADGNGYQVALATLAGLIGSSLGPLTYNANLNALTVYNYGYYGGSPIALASNNTASLTSMLHDMATAVPQGGLAFIPQFMFPITPANFTMPTGIVMASSGTGGTGIGGPTLDHFLIQGDGLLFNCTAVGGHTFGGIRFDNLGIGWASSAPAVAKTSTVILASTTNVKCVGCSFTNCPQVFVADSLSCGLDKCTINYTTGPNGTGPNVPGSFAAVTLQAPEVYVIGPGEFLQTPQSQPGNPSNTNCIAIVGSSENAIVSMLHIQHWSYGITFNVPAVNESQTAVTWPKFTNLEVASWITPVYMQPAIVNAAIGSIYGAKFTSCNFSLDPGDLNAQPSPIINTTISPLVYIDSNGGGNANISDVEFTNCSLYGSNQYGYWITSGQDIRIIGGMSSGNGNTTTNGGNPGAGIAITGSCGYVLALGVNLNPKFNGSAFPARSQTFAILITAPMTSNVIFDNCDMAAAGFPGPPVSVTAAQPAGKLVIKNCPGYNDLNSPLCTASGASAPIAVAVSASTAGTLTGGVNYFGPSFITFTGASAASSIRINGVPANYLASQYVTIYLASPYDTIQFGVAPATFTWTGK
ncbi:MAG: hypothetical protein WCB99_08920 [Candidatus Cybelea sp.]